MLGHEAVRKAGSAWRQRDRDGREKAATWVT